jgi:hypothetical protein
MSTIFFCVACVVLALVVMSKLPGLEHFVKPIVGMLFTLLQAVFENSWAWFMYLFKTLWYSHLDLLKHLTMSEDAIDPSVKMKKEADGPS